jgi:hypothetical protein
VALTLGFDPFGAGSPRAAGAASGAVLVRLVLNRRATEARNLSRANAQFTHERTPRR